jgi:predicted transcriptional regulator of viral defense system
MDYEKHIIARAKKLRVIRPRDLDAPRTALGELVRRGVLERTSRGLYRLPTLEATEHHSLVEVSVSIPHAVVSLLSALQFHGIGTQSPYQVWITINVRARKPRLEYPPLHIMRASGAALTAGIEHHQIEGRRVAIYCLEKTIADCFKYRNKIGLDVALEGLKEAWASKSLNMDALWRYSEICRITNVIRPYVEAIQV